MRSGADLALLVAAGLLPPLAYLSAGLWIVRGLRIRASGAEHLAIAYAFGTGACSLGILGLRLLDVPIPPWALAPVAAVGAVRLADLRESAPAARSAGWPRAVDGLSLAIAILLFAAALGPETFWDGFEYHLPMIQAWCEGPIRALPGMLDAETRAGIDLLYVPAVTAGQPDAAAGVSACFGAALAALIRAEARRRATPAAGALAGLFALTVPLMLDYALSSYVDLGVGTYGFLALLFADRWNRTGDSRCLTWAALAIGFAVNAKLHAAALGPAVLIMAVLGGRRVGLRTLVSGGVVLLAVTAPWFAKTALTTGNPLFPLAGEWLGWGPTTPDHVGLRAYRLSTDYPVPRNLGGFAQFLASHTFGWNPYVGGLIGSLPLALAPLALGRPTRPTLVLMATVAGLVVLQFVFAPALRFASPIVPFYAVAAAIGGVRLAGSAPWARSVLATTLAVLAVHQLVATGLRTLPRVAALRDPAAYVRATFPEQDHLRRVVERAEPVVAIPKGAVLWMPKPVYVLYWERNGELFFDETRGRLTPPDEALAILERQGVRSVVIDAPGRRPRGRVGHATVDAWIAQGRARVRPDPAPLGAARGGSKQRVWVLVDLLP